ncbi:MAG: PAS domain S-box protein [Candidatus Aquicultor sp.]
MKQTFWKDQLGRIVEIIAEGVAVVDTDGRLVFANASAEKILGVKRAIMTQRTYYDPIWNITSPDGTPIDMRKPPFTGILKAGKRVHGVELALDRPNGTKVVLSLNASPLRDEKGVIIGTVATFSDITSRKQADEELKFKSLLLDNATDSVFVYEVEGGRPGKILYVNEAAYKTRGYKKGELLSMRLEDLLAPRYAEICEARADMILKDGRARFESAHVRKDGSVIPVEVYCRAITHKGTKVVLSVARDVAERKELTLQVEHERERIEILAETLEREWDILKTIMENTEAHLAYLDAQFNFVMVNSTYTQGSGYTEDELIGRNLFELFPSEENQAVFERVKDTGETVEFKAKPVEFTDSPHGSITYWDWTLTPVKGTYGQVEGLVLSMVDVTERVLAQELSDALNDISKAINSTLEFEEILQRVVVEATKALGSETAAIALPEGGQWTLRYLYGLPTTLLGSRLTDEMFPDARHLLKKGTPLVCDNAYEDNRVNQELMRTYGIRSFLIVPLIARNDVVGALFFNHHSASVSFSAVQIDFANKLAASISLSLENARLYAAEHNIADTLQEALLTIPEAIEGVEFGYLYRSATEAAKVGGDFYDLFELEHDKIGIVIGDVSGKGLEAATLTSLVKNTIKAYAYENATPSAILAKTNEVVRRAAPPSMFVTVFLGILSTTTGELIYCSAGHPPAIIKRGTSETFLLTTDSPVIGAFSDMDYLDNRHRLERGDILINYTDGVTEARGERGFLGEERLVRLIRCLQPVRGQELPSAVFREVLAYTGGVLSDDLAILSIALA